MPNVVGGEERRRGPRSPAALLALAALAALAGPAARSDPPEAPPREAEVQAAFLFKFFHFVEWPEDLPAEGELRLGVFGDTPVLAVLESLAGREIRGLPVAVRHFRRLEDLEWCHILFIAPASPLEEVLEHLDGSATLTAGGRRSFARRGGMVGFYLEDNKVRFAINVDEARRAGLLVSSKLLRLATVYRDEE